MKYLMTIRPIDVGLPNLSIDSYQKRIAARAVMLDARGRVYLVHMSQAGFYKLPGGGVEEKESLIQAAP